jgi:hypothetical protein
MILVEQQSVALRELKTQLRELVRIRDSQQHQGDKRTLLLVMITQLVQQISGLEQPTGAS